KMGLKEAENIDFKYTNMSLNKVYEVGYKHALDMITKNGGKVNQNEIIINVQQPKTVRLEKSFEGHFPVAKIPVRKDLKTEYSIDFDGIGIVMKGSANKEKDITEDRIFDLSLFIDGKEVENFKMSTNSHDRRHDVFWRYQLPKGKHTAKIVVNNPQQGYNIRLNDAIIYSDKIIDGQQVHSNK